jgi:integrase/recombinase XerD
MGNSVAQNCAATMRVRPASPAFSLYTMSGERKYLNRSERSRALKAMRGLPVKRRLFACTLAWSGGRISEVLSLAPRDFQAEENLVTFRTLKRRRLHIREVPAPPFLMRDLERHFRLQESMADPDESTRRLWAFSRTTAWRIIKEVMVAAGIHGAKACPKGFRHAFGRGTIQAGIPETQVQRWLGHARLETTSIYTEAAGPEEFDLARRFWRWSGQGRT